MMMLTRESEMDLSLDDPVVAKHIYSLIEQGANAYYATHTYACSSKGLTKEDLFGYAAERVLTDFARFDANQSRLKTFIIALAKFGCIEGLRKENTIKIPKGLFANIRLLKKTELAWGEKYQDKTCSNETLLNLLNDEDVKTHWDLKKLQGVRRALQVLRLDTLNENVFDDEDDSDSRIETVKSSGLTPEEAAEQDDIADVIVHCMDRLNNNERMIVQLVALEGYTLKEAGKVLGLKVTEQYISELKKGAFATLHACCTSYALGVENIRDR